MVVTIDLLQAQALGSLPLAAPPESSYPGQSVHEQNPALAQLTASSSSPDDSVLPGSSSPLVPEDFKAYQDFLWHMTVSSRYPSRVPAEEHPQITGYPAAICPWENHLPY